MFGYNRGREILKNPYLDGVRATAGNPVTPNTAGGVTLEPLARQVQFARLRLTNFTVNIDADDDFGSKKLLDLPAGAVIVSAAVVDLTVAVAGFQTNTVANLDLALGTAAIATVDFTGAGEDNITPKIDGVGAGATGTMKGNSTVASSTFNVPLDPGAKAIYVNCVDVTNADGTVTLNGLIEVGFIDLGAPA